MSVAASLLIDLTAVVALTLAFPSLWYAFKAHHQAAEAAGQLGAVHEMVERVERGVTAMDQTAADQIASLASLEEQTAVISATVDSLSGACPTSTDEDESGPPPPLESDADLADSVLMTPVAPSRLDHDIADAIHETASSNVSWALRRRGPGIPRWLVGTTDGRVWRAVRWRGEPRVEAVGEDVEHPLVPVTIAGLADPDGARATLDRMLGDGEALEVLLQRKSRGAPVFYAMTTNGRVLRLVRTRWGWGGSQEEE